MYKLQTIAMGLLLYISQAFSFEGTPSPNILDGTIFTGLLTARGKADTQFDERIAFEDARAESAWATKHGFEKLKWKGLGEISGDQKSETVQFAVTGKNDRGDALTIDFEVRDTAKLSATYSLKMKNGEFQIYECTAKILSKLKEGLTADGEKKLAMLLELAADSKSFEAELGKFQLDGTAESIFILTYAMMELPWLEPKSNPNHRMPKIAVEAALDKLIASTEHDKLRARYFRAVVAGDAAEAKANLLRWTLENVKKMKWNGVRFEPN